MNCSDFMLAKKQTGLICLGAALPNKRLQRIPERTSLLSAWASRSSAALDA